MKRHFDLALLALGIILTALGIIYKDGEVFARILLSGGIALLLIIALLKYIPPLWAKHFDLRINPVILRLGGENKAVEDIFEEAAKSGGELLTTNVLHKDLEPGSDWALKHFRRAHPKQTLTFKRLLLVNDALEEHKWLREFFQAIGESHNVDATIFVFKNFGSSFLGVVERFIPRVNLILFQLEQKQYVYVGFDRLYREDRRLHQSVGFISKSDKVYKLIRPYFDMLVSHQNIISIDSLDKLRPVERDKYQWDYVDAAIARLEKVALDTNFVLHLGIFGSQARMFSGIHAMQSKEPFDSDVDVLFVVPNRDTIAPLKEELQHRLSEQFKIVWGDDDTNFYHFREALTLDIEIHEMGSTFYSDNLLLGISVFSYYERVFSNDNVCLSDILAIPVQNLPIERRKGILLQSRKGIADCIDRLSGSPDVVIDPRRIVSLALRNLVWCHSGKYPANYADAASYLLALQCPPIATDAVTLSQNILNMSKDEIESQYLVVKQQALNILEKIRSSNF